MNYYPHKKPLLSVSAESINTEQTGTTYRVSTSENDEVSRAVREPEQTAHPT